MSILLVEDSERIRALVRAILAPGCWPVVEADTAESALALVEENPNGLELLITDLAMPGMSGLDLAKRLRERYPGLRVLCMSGHTLPSGPADGIHFIGKPFRPDEFLGRVRDLLKAPRLGS